MFRKDHRIRFSAYLLWFFKKKKIFFFRGYGVSYFRSKELFQTITSGTKCIPLESAFQAESNGTKLDGIFPKFMCENHKKLQLSVFFRHFHIFIAAECLHIWHHWKVRAILFPMVPRMSQLHAFGQVPRVFFNPCRMHARNSKSENVCAQRWRAIWVGMFYSTTNNTKHIYNKIMTPDC